VKFSNDGGDPHPMDKLDSLVSTTCKSDGGGGTKKVNL